MRTPSSPRGIYSIPAPCSSSWKPTFVSSQPISNTLCLLQDDRALTSAPHCGRTHTVPTAHAPPALPDTAWAPRTCPRAHVCPLVIHVTTLSIALAVTAACSRFPDLDLEITSLSSELEGDYPSLPFALLGKSLLPLFVCFVVNFSNVVQLVKTSTGTVPSVCKALHCISYRPPVSPRSHC